MLLTVLSVLAVVAVVFALGGCVIAIDAIRVALLMEDDQ